MPLGNEFGSAQLPWLKAEKRCFPKDKIVLLSEIDAEQGKAIGTY